ncbi:MAG: rhodanese-like domain-containing protein [Candidatus Eremiobacteraeota bacterium]|nr:rhodanese-like domain-containing protein [Candidatus Eremiobacteraeota bacterium]
MREILVEELAQWRKAGKTFVLLDVREHAEVRTASIPGAVHIPMGEIPTRITELQKDQEIVVMCHHGGRSERVAQYLEDQGYGQAINLDGGIHAWSLQVDSSVPTY